MPITALELAADVYKQANLDQTLSSFSMTEFPYNVALSLLNETLCDLNRQSRYWFAETSTTLTYSPGVYTYSLTTLNIDPKGILRIVREASGFQGELTQINEYEFWKRYRQSSIITDMPQYWRKYGSTIELNSIPDQNYSLRVYYLQDLPLIASTTDTFLVPDTDSDILKDGLYAYLLQRIGRPDWQIAYQAWVLKVKSLTAGQKQDVGIARQMPAAF